MRKPKWMRKARANAGGYFWLPCPICGEMFGGFEWKSGHSLMTSKSEGVGVCPKKKCKEEADRRNLEKFGVTW